MAQPKKEERLTDLAVLEVAGRHLQNVVLRGGEEWRSRGKKMRQM